jgi:hypothetical protein
MQAVVDTFESLESRIQQKGIGGDWARVLFLDAVQNKRADHWRLCLISYHVVGLRDGSTERLANESDSSVDSIEDYSRTYRLYRAIRVRYDRLRLLGIGRDPKHAQVYERAYRQVLSDLRDLRNDLHYTKWLIVANAVYTGWKTKDGRKRLTIPQAFDALKSGADGNTEMFAALVQGAEFTRDKANRKARRAILGVLSFPRRKRDNMALKRALLIVEKELGVENGNTKR